MYVFAETRKGIGNNDNEDRIVVGTTILSNGIYRCESQTGAIAVIDGVGGNNAGGIASHFIANRLGEIETCSKQFFEHINNELINYSETNISCRNMATTASGIYRNDNEIYCFHIGNSRVYSILAGNYLKQLTEDDTTLNYLIKTGKLEPDSDLISIDKNEITSCFGAGNPSIFNIKINLISDAQAFLLTTDGIHDFVSIDELEKILQDEDCLSSCCSKIIDQAVENGSSDDLSVIIVIRK